MDHRAELRRCLVECDVAGIRAVWVHVFPSMPQPETEEDALVSIHMARVRTESIPFRLRAYSHSWLMERTYPSGLPDELKPKAERMYPRAVGAVGISVRTMNNQQTERGAALERTISDAVMDAYADGREDPEFVRARMMEAKDKFLETE